MLAACRLILASHALRITTICSYCSTTKCSWMRDRVVGMATTRGERLRIAREKRFKSGRAAANAMGIAVSTYGAHERAEAPGGRDYGPDEAKRYARRFQVTPEWLLTGRGRGPGEEPPFEAEAPDVSGAPKISVVGYVGAGAA